MATPKPSRLANADSLRVFLSVAETGSMQEAGGKTGITQSAVSQTIRNLEEQFGVVLFNRESRPLTLTPFGLALRNRAAEILEKLSNLKAQVLDAGAGIQPELRIGLVDSFASTCGTEFIKELLTKSTRLTVHTGLSPFHGERLMRREVDLIVSSDAMLDVDDVMRRPLISEKYLLVTPANAGASITGIEDIRILSKQLPIVRFSRHSQTGIQVNRFLRSIEVKQPSWLEVDSAEALTGFVASGIGWAITTPMCLLQAAAAAKKVIMHHKVPLGISRSIYIIARREEFGVFFDEAFNAARRVIERHFLPNLHRLNDHLAKLVVSDDSQ